MAREKTTRRFGHLRLALPGVLCAIWLPGAAAAPADDDLFRRGREQVTKSRYQQAIPILKRYLREFPNGQHASRAGLFLGKAHMGEGKYDQARKSFQMTIDRYPKALEAHKSAYKLAVIAFLEGKRDEATKRFQAVADSKNGPLVPEAQCFLRLLQSSK